MQQLAQLTNPAINGPLANITDPTQSFNSIISLLITLAFIIGIIVFIGYFIWGAIRWIISEGEKPKMEEAKKHITQAVTGIVILLLIFLILTLIGNIFSVDLLNLTLPTI